MCVCVCVCVFGKSPSEFHISSNPGGELQSKWCVCLFNLFCMFLYDCLYVEEMKASSVCVFLHVYL